MKKDDFVWVNSFVTYGYAFEFLANILEYFRKRCKHPCYYLLVVDETSDYRWFRVLFYDVKQWRMFHRYLEALDIESIAGDMPCAIGSNNTTNNEIWQT
jgi:hypothetical protein